MLVVAALGGNALSRRGEPPDPECQRRRVESAADALAALAAAHGLVVTHGNGPQVGLLALQAEARPAGQRPSLDELGAETEGMIGYWIEQALTNRLPGREVATLLTRVEVDPGDPAFGVPSKPIGAVYEAEEGRALAEARGWALAPDAGGVRRVVPSPEPRAILELRTVRLLLRAGVVVVCAGGGGIPVARDAEGRMRGIEAVIDKDLSAALLADTLDADVLLLLTDVPGVFADWPAAREPLREIGPAELRRVPADPGTMGPKIEAACRFVEGAREGAQRRAAIGALDDAEAVLSGAAGTQVVAAPRPRS